MSIELATPNDIKEIAALYVSCTDAMISKGIYQWNYTYPLESDVQLDVENHDLYKYQSEGNVMGVVSINQEQDEQYKDVIWRFKEPCMVIHRFAVHPKFQNKGIGTLLMKFAIDYARDKKMSSIRLDAFSSNPWSNYLYEKLGFNKANGFCYFHGSKIPFNCWEYCFK